MNTPTKGDRTESKYAPDEMVCATKVDGTWRGIFKLQDRMVRELIGGLRLTVDNREKRRVTMFQTDYLDAYEQYSRGRSSSTKWVKELSMGRIRIETA